MIADAREAGRAGRGEKGKKKMKEILERLWHDWCFEQGIESGPLSMADIADFFDYVELWTDAMEDDGK